MSDTLLWNKSIKMVTFELLNNNKNQFFTVTQIKEKILTTQKWLRDIDCVKWLAFSNGLDGKITQSIHSLKEDGHYIVSSDKKGKGYTYLNPNNENTPNDWDSKFNANETEREQIPKTERLLDRELFIKCFMQTTDVKIRNDMQKIAIKHRIKIKK